MPIEVKNLSYTYAGNTPLEVKALANISFQVKDGEFVGIMGHTGCGKSTLIQLLAGLLPPSGGEIWVDGMDINHPRYDRKLLRRTLGIVFQYPEYQLFETTVERDVAFALKNAGYGDPEVRERVSWALQTLGFDYEEIRKKSPLSLSGGEKRRVAIAGVLAARPGILIFDEPIAGLDPCGRQEFLELAARLNREGTTILMVSHNAGCLCEYAHRILVLCGGELAMDGTPGEVFRDVEKAEKMHIGASDIGYLAGQLYARGIFPSPNITRYREFVDAIKTALKGGG